MATCQVATSTAALLLLHIGSLLVCTGATPTHSPPECDWPAAGADRCYMSVPADRFAGGAVPHAEATSLCAGANATLPIVYTEAAAIALEQYMAEVGAHRLWVNGKPSYYPCLPDAWMVQFPATDDSSAITQEHIPESMWDILGGQPDAECDQQAGAADARECIQWVQGRRMHSESCTTWPLKQLVCEAGSAFDNSTTTTVVTLGTTTVGTMRTVPATAIRYRRVKRTKRYHIEWKANKATFYAACVLSTIALVAASALSAALGQAAYRHWRANRNLLRDIERIRRENSKRHRPPTNTANPSA